MLYDTLTQIGLTDPQARAYSALIVSGASTPPQLAKQLKLTRTNAYKVLDSLVDIKLATKVEQDKKLTYHPSNPTALDALIKAQRDQILQKEATLQSHMPALLTHYFSHASQPGVRFYQGAAGIKQVLKDVVKTKQPLYLIRSTADVKFFDQKFFAEHRRQRTNAGIHTQALTVYSDTAVQDPALDRLNKFSRTWLPKNSYTAPVQWNIYGNKVSILSYDNEAMGMIIDSPQIAESMRQLFKLIQNGQQSNQQDSHTSSPDATE